MSLFVDREVKERIENLDVTFNRFGYDKYGISAHRLGMFYSMLKPFYRQYFRVETVDIHHVPDQGRGMLISNHSGGIPVDAGMLLASMVLDKNPPRLAHGMVEKFAAKWMFVSHWFPRLGQFTGLPQHAIRILEEERLLLVYPEGARGTGKLFKDRYKLVRFGTGFMRLALQTHTPIIPSAFIGGEEAMPVMYHANTLGRLIGAPYWPVPKHIVPLPLPVRCQIRFGAPMKFEGTGNESDETIQGYVHQVKDKVTELMDAGIEDCGLEPVSRGVA
jgi:1-acyl-sn-glycerol-3-phosphate acyltransferase